MSSLHHPVSRRGFLAGAAASGALIMLHPFSAHAQANQAHLRIMETTDIHVNVLPYDYYADKANDTMGLKPYVILDKKIKDGSGGEQPIKIGIIGFVPPQVMIWDLKNLEGNVRTRDIVEAAKAWVPQIKEEGADIVIALSHSGIDVKQGDGMENASFFVAGVEGIDAVFTGHQHLVFPGKKDFQALDGVDTEKGTLQGKPAVMGGFWGSHMGLIDLLLERDGSKWRVVSAASEARPIYERVDKANKPTVADDQRVVDALKADHEATLAYVRRPVGKTSAPLYSYFALVADDPSVQIVNQAQSWYLKDILKATQWKDVPLLSAAAPFKAGGRNGADYYTDVPVGDIAIKNVADLYLYPNTVRAVEITGAQVKEWLEMSAGIFKRIEAGKADQALIDTEFPSYNFDVIDGVSYKIDLSQPPKYDAKGGVANAGSSRIVDLSFDGKPIDPAAKFVVATNNYRAGGGGNFPDINASKIIYEAPDTNRDVIVRYVVSEGTINPSADDNWSFTPLPGTSAVFETGPRAKDFISGVKSLKIEPAGEGEAGFAKYRILL